MNAERLLQQQITPTVRENGLVPRRLACLLFIQSPLLFIFCHSDSYRPYVVCHVLVAACFNLVVAVQHQAALVVLFSPSEIGPSITCTRYIVLEYNCSYNCCNCAVPLTAAGNKQQSNRSNRFQNLTQDVIRTLYGEKSHDSTNHIT